MRWVRVAFLVAGLDGWGCAQPGSWTSQDKIALAYYYYWYDVNVGKRNISGVAEMTLHPPDSYLSTYTFANLVFHQRELSDMAAAGIDVALPMFQGDAQSVSTWSVAGLQMMVQAEQALAQAGRPAPKIGMFVGTQSLPMSNGGTPPDLTTAAGKSLLYGEIHTFFSNVPRQYWAMIDGRPIVVFYTSDFLADYDQTTFDDISQQFQQDFGTTPYFILHRGWFGGLNVDAVYEGWPTFYGAGMFDDVASVSPGFDNQAVAQGTGRHIVVDRNCGDHYQQQWDQVISHNMRLVFVETWNELQDGSGISATKEYGRRYIDQTARNVARWKSTTSNPSPPDMVWVSLGPQIYSSGMWPVINYGAGAWLATRIAGHDAIYADRSAQANSIELAVDDNFLTSGSEEVWLTVEYLDAGNAPWRMIYDGANGRNTATAVVTPQDSGLWKQQTFHLPDARFRKREGGGLADLIIIDGVDPSGPHYFNRIWITKSQPAGQAPQEPVAPDVTVQAGDSMDVALSAMDASGMAVPLSLAAAPGFATLAGDTGSQTVHLAPALSDVRACADVMGPEVTSTASYMVSAVANDPNNLPLTGVSVFAVTVAAPDVGAAQPPLL